MMDGTRGASMSAKGLLASATLASGYAGGGSAQSGAESPVEGRSATRDARRVSAISARGFLVWFALSFVLSFGLIWLYVAAMPMAFLTEDYAVWVGKRAMLNECRLGEVSVFGDSRAMAGMVPSEMPIPVANLALSGTSPIETYFAVSRALRCPNPPKLVVISHSLPKFMDDSIYWDFSARTGFLNYAQMRAVDADAARLHDNQIARQRRSDGLALALRDRLFSLRFPPFYFDSLVNGYFASRWEHNRGIAHDIQQNDGHALFGKDPGASTIAIEGEPGFAQNYAISPLIDSYFSRTLALLAAHHIPVVALTMPINQATFDRTPSKLADQLTAYFQAKAKEFSGLHVVGPAIPCWPNEYYGDAWHLNAREPRPIARNWAHGCRTSLTAARLRLCRITANCRIGVSARDWVDSARARPGAWSSDAEPEPGEAIGFNAPRCRRFSRRPVRFLRKINEDGMASLFRANDCCVSA